MKKSDFQFVHPYLQKFFFVENDQFDFDMDTEEIEMHNTFSLQINKSTEEPFAIVTLNFEMNKDEKKAPFKIEASISSLFRWQTMNDEQVDRMLRINAPAVLLSYLRPIISQITNSSKFPVYDLPFLNFADEQVTIKND